MPEHEPTNALQKKRLRNLTQVEIYERIDAAARLRERAMDNVNGLTGSKWNHERASSLMLGSISLQLEALRLQLELGQPNRADLPGQ